MKSPSCKEIMRNARVQLVGHYHLPMRAFIFTSLILSLIEWPFSRLYDANPYLRQTIILIVVEILITLIHSLFMCGQFRIHMNMVRQKDTTLSDLFWPFRNRPDRYLTAAILLFLLNILGLIPGVGGFLVYYYMHYSIFIAIIGGILSIIAMICIQLRYTFLYLILLDKEDITTLKAMQHAGNLIAGHTGKLIQFYLCFIGYFLLAACSLGIGLLWVYPYYLQSTVSFYRFLTGEEKSSSIDVAA